MMIDKYFDGVLDNPLSDLPFQASAKDYESAIEFLVAYWNSLSPKPIAIYQLGEITAPGISDLDFILVFTDKKPLLWAQYQVQTLPEWVRRVMDHPPYCCTESAWRQLYAWFQVFNLSHIWGEILPEPTISEHLVPGCALGFLVDYLIVKVPADFFRIAWGLPMRMRIMLSMIYSLKYTLRLTEQAGLSVPEGFSGVVLDIDILRKQWFNLLDTDRSDRFVQLCKRAIDISGKLLAQVDKTLSQGQDIDKYSGYVYRKDTCNQNVCNIFKFNAAWNFEYAVETAFRDYSSYHQFDWISPASFLRVLAVYADECSAFKRYLFTHRHRFGIQLNSDVWGPGLRYHARAMINYANSARMLNVPPQKYIALGYYPQQPLHRFTMRYFMRLRNYLKKVLKTAEGSRV